MIVSLASVGRVILIGSRLSILALTMGSTCALGTTIAKGGASLSAKWRLVENRPDNHFLAELTLRNDGDEPLASPWALYFNSSGRLEPKSVKPLFVLEHVNGDLYVLRPAATCPPIASGDERKLSLVGGPWAINVSDAPSGLYLVRTSATGVELPPVDVSLELADFPNALKLRRGQGDQVPVVTAASRFAANAALTVLPTDEFPVVVPTPTMATKLPGKVTIDASTTVAHDPALENEAKFLAAALQQNFGLQLATQLTSDRRPNSIRLRLGDLKASGDKVSGDEAYELSVTPEAGIEIVGRDPAGVFYGIQTLRGLVPLSAYDAPGQPLAVDAVKIADAPRFDYRGLHLDVARNFQSVQTVKKLLDLMAFYKLNRFHWHLSDDEGWRVEIRALPELTSVGSRRGYPLGEQEFLISSFGSGPDPAKSPGSGHYTQEEFEDILRYAHERHIKVIPEIDVPGHSRAAIKAMAARARREGADSDDFQLVDPNDRSQYESVQAWRDNVIDVGRDATYKFLDVVIDELATMYRRAGVPFESMHLGGDEVPKGAWEMSPACQSISTPGSKNARGLQLEVYFLKRACGIAAKHGATPACWDDCLLAAAGNGEWPARPTAYVWNNVWGWGHEDAAYQLANADFDVVLANATNLYFDLAYEKDPLEPGYYWAGFVDNRAPFEFDPFDIFQNARTNAMGQSLADDQFAKSVRLTPAGRSHIRGLQGNLWGENLRSAERLDYMAFPRTIALAERAWAAEPEFAKLQDRTAREAALAAAWSQFANALGQRELPRLGNIAAGVNSRIPPPGAIIREGKLHANAAFPGMSIRYTTDGSEPTTASTLYQGPVSVPLGTRLRAFDLNGHGSRSTTVDAPHQE